MHHSDCLGDKSYDLHCFAHKMNICCLTSIWRQTYARVYWHSLTHKHAKRRRSLAPLLVTCNYVAMMSLIFCTGWKLCNVKQLASTGKCLAVWNINVLICERWQKGKYFSIQLPSPANVYLHRVESEGKLTDWVFRRLTQPWWTCQIQVSWLTGQWTGPGALTGWRGKGGKENKQWRKKRNDRPVRGERHWRVSFRIRYPLLRKKWQLHFQNDW